MEKGIWVSPSRYVSFSDMKTSSLQNELATRSAAWDFSELIGLLPDPDPVLRKRGDGAEILDELTSDGHLLSVMLQRKSGVLKKEFKFEPGTDEDGKKSSQSEQLCDDFNRDLQSLKPRDLTASILNAPYYGMTPVELTFAPGEGRLRLAKAEAKPVRWFGFDEKNELRFRSQDEPDEGEKIPWGKVVLARHLPDYDNPYGVRLLTRCFWPITFKKGGLKFWVTFMEKYGMPFLLGHYQKGTGQDEQQAMLDKLVRMVRNAVAVVPEGDKIEMLGGSKNTGSGYAIFERMKSAMDAEISKVIIGQTLTSEAGDKGSYGLGKVHGDVLADLQDADQTMVKMTYDEIAEIYTRINADSVPAPTCSFFEEEDPLQEFADRDKALEESGRVRLTKSYYMRRYGFQDDDFNLVETDGDDEPKPGDEPADHSESNQQTEPLDFEEQAQNELDTSADDYIRHGGDIFAVFKTGVRKWAEKYDSVEEALADVTSLIDGMEIADLADSLFSALMEAEQLGSSSIQDFSETLWGANKPFKEQVDFFKAKSLTIAGNTRNDIAAGIKDELLRIMEDGGSQREFRRNIDNLFISKGLDPIASHRIDTIYRTNMQTAFMAGRYQQLTKPAILKHRPYWKYVAVNDGNTRPAHKEMHGKVFHHTNPIWNKWFPPNGFNCRCKVVSVSEREVKRDGLTVIDHDPSGGGFEVINKETGEIKRFELEPDEGWSSGTGSLKSLLEEERKRDILTERPGLTGPSDLERPLAADIDQSSWKKIKPLSNMDDLDEIESSFRKTMGIAPLEYQTALRTKNGEVVTASIDGLVETLFADEGMAEFVPALREVIENPFEILLSEYQTESGKTIYRKKHIGLYRDESGERFVLAAIEQKDGSVAWKSIGYELADSLRHGIESIYGK